MSSRTSSARMSVLAHSKPKPKAAPFRFLRRDEGRLSYSQAAPDTPTGGDSGSDPLHNRDRRDSKTLREAIAHDMRNAKSHDPLGEVVVAVPKRSVPPNSAASQNDRPPHKKAPPRAASQKMRPEWVNPEVPQRAPFEVKAPIALHPAPSSHANSATNSTANHTNLDGPDAPCEPTSENVASDHYMRGGQPTDNGLRAPRRSASVTVSHRYVDPIFSYDDYAGSPMREQNYFRRPLQREYCATGSRSREEEDMMMQLEDEVRAAQEERTRYMRYKQQLDREKQRFEDYRFNVKQQLEDERAELESNRLKDEVQAKKDLKALEDRYKNVSGLLATERANSRKLADENEALRNQLEDLTAAMREGQKVHKSETTRLRRDIDSLTLRNSELLAMTKEQQLHSLHSRSTPPHLSIESVPQINSVPTRSRELSLHPVVMQSPAVSHAAAGGASNENGGSPEQTSTPGRTPPHVQEVLDFTPRAGRDDAARERRAREMEERMRHEEEEMQRRRQKREKEAAERKQREEERAREMEERQKQAYVEEQRRREEKRKREVSINKRAEETPKKQAAVPKSVETTSKTVEVSRGKTDTVMKAREDAGHPVHTPRMVGGAKSSPVATIARKQPPLPPQSSGTVTNIPTVADLVGTREESPEEDIPNDEIISQTPLGDNPNKREVLYRSGKRVTFYANGTRKVFLPSGHTVLHFTNGDIKCTYASGCSTYWYDAAKTTHTQRADGVQIFEFLATGQTEKHLPDGSKHILYPDGIYKIVQADGTDETFYPDEQ